MFCTVGRLIILGFFLYWLMRVIQDHNAENSEERERST
jgi:hypothetical protein